MLLSVVVVLALFEPSEVDGFDPFEGVESDAEKTDEGAEPAEVSEGPADPFQGQASAAPVPASNPPPGETAENADSAASGPLNAQGEGSDWDARRKASRFDRQGFALRLGLGVGGCFREWCSNDVARIRAGVATHLELGYRPIEYVSFGGRLGLQWMPIDADDGDLNAGALMLTPDAFVYVHPLPFTRFDPYFGLGLGMLWHRDRYRRTQGGGSGPNDYALSFRRAMARVSVGADVYVAEHVALGPRFDYILPFAGQYCTTEDIAIPGLEDVDVDLGPEAGECASVSDSFANDTQDELAHPWAFALNVSFVF